MLLEALCVEDMKEDVSTSTYLQIYDLFRR